MLRGENLIGSQSVKGGGAAFTAFDPAKQQALDCEFHAATEEQLEQACALAASAARPLADMLRQKRAAFLDAIADGLMAAQAEIVPMAMAESGLPEMRVTGELGRTANQLRLFAEVLRDGAYLDVRVDHALPDRAPPRPDIRLINRALGPVAVFGASNFPLAFSTAGGDTASALAAGCPVIVKAHHGHPGTSELVGRVVQQAVADCGMPEGTFSLLFGSGQVIGQGLVSDPRIQAVGFTGSRAGGLALCATSQARKVPIPVYAEMSSINPVVLMPGALSERAAAIGTGFAQSQTMGAGQFCTNPGLLLAVDCPELDAFVEGVREGYAAIAAQTMLTQGIHQAYCAGVEALSANRAVTTLVEGQAGEGLVSQARLFGTTAEAFLADKSLSEEVFGSASLLVKCSSMGELAEVLQSLEGQLTAALHLADSDHVEVERLLPLLDAIAGRVLFDGFGTGVEVCHAMVHGGPFPATSDVRSTSVGSLAIARFLRPVSYQNVPQGLLPADLRDENLGNIPHRLNGALVRR